MANQAVEPHSVPPGCQGSAGDLSHLHGINRIPAVMAASPEIGFENDRPVGQAPLPELLNSMDSFVFPTIPDYLSDQCIEVR
jgi:hypothetical protein